ncbi:CaiB/BaiF CoA-transferase family protein [Pseudophaeobacter sp.]|jgi:alpha-methylacyl-CoA racemase|uniref:CaiB/BaiF CoA transferase family protein n=1 Tax=Pseudophaeobacter sp. TaxID=1971739 RepID=UPI0032D97F1F
MGPLAGLKVIEVASIGPGPFAAMMLADMGADVLRIDRPEMVNSKDERNPRFESLNRGRGSVALDLKNPDGVDALLRLVERADILIEGFRPGVMERLGVGPDVCGTRNPRLVYGRMTGWGQTGPLSQAAGHDINYIALSGVLHAIGRADETPVPPLNLVGDFGGGAMYLLFGLMAALWERAQSGRGQVVDAAILDGAVSLGGFVPAAIQRGTWKNERGANHLDGGHPWYDSYKCADGNYISIGALEPKFYLTLVQKLGLSQADLPDRSDPAHWPKLRRRFKAIFQSRTREEWVALLQGTEACFAPVLDVMEAMDHPQNLARNNHIKVDGVTQAAPAPRFSRTRAGAPRPAVRAGARTREDLCDWGFTTDEVDQLIASGVAVQRPDQGASKTNQTGENCDRE